MPRLIVVKGKDKGLTLDLQARRPVRVGRRSDNELPLNDSSLSRYHCEFLFDGTEVTLKDLGSRHGTFLHEKSVQTTVLQDGDEVRLGASCIRLEMTGKPADRAKEPEEESKTPAEREEPARVKAEDKADKRGKRPADLPRPPSEESKEKTLPASDAPIKFPEPPPKGAEGDREEGGLLKMTPEQKKRQMVMTVGAVVAVLLLVIVGTLFVRQFFGQPQAPEPVPMSQLSDIDIEVNRKRLLIPQPPTYILDIQIRNKQDKPILVRYKDFLVVDRAGIAYLPLDPTSQNDLEKAQIDVGGSLRCSLNFELNMGAELARIVFQRRGYLVLD